MLSRILFHPGNESGRADLMLLLLRLTLAAYLIVGGYNKFFGAAGPMGWMGATPPYPGWLLFLAAFAELFGGLALVVGLLSRIAAFGVACVAGVAGFYQHAVLNGRPFVRSAMQLPVELPTWLVQGQGMGNYAFEVLIFVVALTIMIVGPGRASIDALIFRLGGGHRRRASFIPA
jgi:putative oxidoreductase